MPVEEEAVTALVGEAVGRRRTPRRRRESGQIDRHDESQVEDIARFHEDERRRARDRQEPPRLFRVEIAEGLVEQQFAVAREDHRLAHRERPERALSGQPARQQVGDVLAAGQGPRLFAQQALQLRHGRLDPVAGLLARARRQSLHGETIHEQSGQQQRQQAEHQHRREEPLLETERRPGPARQPQRQQRRDQARGEQQIEQDQA